METQREGSIKRKGKETAAIMQTKNCGSLNYVRRGHGDKRIRNTEREKSIESADWLWKRGEKKERGEHKISQVPG